MAIKENQLPTAQEVTENNLIRTVDENGASQNMTVEQLGGLVGGGGALFVTVTENNGSYSADKTFSEINQAFTSGILIFAKLVNNIQPGRYTANICPLIFATESVFIFAASYMDEDDGDYTVHSYEFFITDNNLVMFNERHVLN